MRRGILLLSLLLPVAAQAGVYRCKDASGQTVVSDRPCGADAENVEKRYARPASSADPDVVDEIARRRDFYISQGYPKDLAAQKALMEVAPESSAPAPARTGRDNNREYLRQREAEKEEQEAQRREWLRRSDIADAEREQQNRDEADEKRRKDCEHNRRVEELRQGYSSRRCY